MASTHAIYSTVVTWGDEPSVKGVHIIADGHYQGKIDPWKDSFGKGIVRFFSTPGPLDTPIQVQIGDKRRDLDRRSYIAFLSTLGFENVTTSALDAIFTDLNRLSFVAKTDQGFTHDHIGSKSRIIGKKMFSFMLMHGFTDETKAYVEKKVAKGAHPGATSCVSFKATGSYYQGLPFSKSDSAPGLHSTMSPYLYAALHGEQDYIALFQKYAGCGLDLNATECHVDHFGQYVNKVTEDRKSDEQQMGD